MGPLGGTALLRQEVFHRRAHFSFDASEAVRGILARAAGGVPVEPLRVAARGREVASAMLVMNGERFDCLPVEQRGAMFQLQDAAPRRGGLGVVTIAPVPKRKAPKRSSTKPAPRSCGWCSS